MNKRVWIVISIILLITVIIESVFVGIYFNKEEPTISISENPGYSAWQTTYTLDNGYDIPCIRVYIRGNQKLEDKVNESLVKCFNILEEPFIGESVTETFPPIIHLQSSRYLSVEYSFKYLKQYCDEDSTYWHLCVTVDMQTGEIVFLDDIIDLNDDFYKHMKNNRILRRNGNDFVTAQIVADMTIQDLIDQANDSISEYGLEYIEMDFNDFTRDNLYGDYYLKNDEYVDYPHLYKTFFYLEEDYIFFSELAGCSNVYIKYDDLEEYLNVSLP